MSDSLKLEWDTLGIISLFATFISILFSVNLSINDVVLSTGVFMIILSTYAYMAFKKVINEHAIEIKKINDKVNIYRDISDLKAKVDLLMNNKMNKRGKADFLEIMIRLIQIGAIIFAIYIIMKALGSI